MATFHSVSSLGSGLYRVTYTKMGLTPEGQSIEVVADTEDLSVAQLNDQLNEWENRKNDAELNIARIQNIITQIGNL